MIEIQNLRFQYDNNRDVLSFPDFRLVENEDLLIMGKSGVGKTTLLHLLAGLLRSNRGEIGIHGTNIKNLSNSKLDAFRGANIGLVFQRKSAVQTLSVYDNVAARLYFSKKTIQKHTIDDLLDTLGILEHKHSAIQSLSEGQLQRLNIALSVVHQPKVILADEPTSSLDDENCTIVMDLLKEQAKIHQANLIVITHDQRVKPYFQNTITL